MAQKRNRNEQFSKSYMTSLNGTQIGEAFESFVTTTKKEQRPKSYPTRTYFQRLEDAALAKGTTDNHIDLATNANGASVGGPGPVNKNKDIADVGIEQMFQDNPPSRPMPPGEEARHARFCQNAGRTHCLVCHGLGQAAFNKQEHIRLKKARQDMKDKLAALKAEFDANKAIFGNE